MFGHLQVYSSYSFQESTILIPDLVRDASSKHIDALALTDKDNMYGMMEFHHACNKYHIRPIYGLEASILIDEDIYPFTLLAIDDMGYFDLIKITTDINLSPQKALPLETLATYQKHLYIISASQEGIVQRLIMKEMEDEAVKYLQKFKSLFLDHYYVMIQNHHLKHQQVLNDRLISLARYTQVKVLCSNEVSYLKPSEALALDLMKASSTNTQLDDKHEPLTTEKYLKTEKEMVDLFPIEIIEETRQVMMSCKATIPLNTWHLPSYPVPHNGKASEYLYSLCQMGMKKRFQGETIPHTYIERLKYELSIIHQMGFDDYFLIVWDYVRYAKVNKIQVRPRKRKCGGKFGGLCFRNYKC